MEYGIESEVLYSKKLEIGSAFNFSQVEILKAGIGALEAGQVLAYDPASLKMVKYVAGASDGTEVIVGVLLEDVTVGVADNSGLVLRQGKVVESSLVGIDYIITNVTTADPTVTKLAGGSLTADDYEYSVMGVSTSGNTVPSGLVTGTTETTNLTLQVDFVISVTMDTARIWRTIDSGTNYVYYDVTADELAQGYILDDGTLTWTSGTPVTATDYAGIKSLEAAGIYPNSSKNGYSFRK